MSRTKVPPTTRLAGHDRRTRPAGRIAGALRWLGRELVVGGEQLEAVRGPALTCRAAIWFSLLVVAWGNAVVVIGRITHEHEWVTLIANSLFALACLYLLRVGGWSRSSRGSGSPRLRGQVVVSTLVILAGVWACAWLIGAVAGPRDVSLLRTVRLVVGTAWAEEAIHRGALVAVWLSAGVGVWALFAANVLTFGAWHVAGAFSEGAFHPLDVIVPSLGAVGFLWARQRTASFLGPALGHLAVNITGLSAITAVRG